MSRSCKIYKHVILDVGYEKVYFTYNCIIHNFYGCCSKNSNICNIKEWNENVASGRVSYNNKWVNWFNPIDYNQFEYIEMPKFEEKVS